MDCSSVTFSVNWPLTFIFSYWYPEDTNLTEYGAIFSFSDSTKDDSFLRCAETVQSNQHDLVFQIREGNVYNANKMLGYKYYIKGEIIKGDGIGKKINYPTANINPYENSKLIPGNGVYVSEVEMDGKKLNGMLNIGNRPTVDGKERRIELHIFNFNSIIYGKKLKISLITKIREEIKFNSLEKLKEQLIKDEIKSIKILNHEKIGN